jgi:hypothetical protein
MKNRNKQCKACPWKKTTIPNKDIPNNYCATKHANLKNTIARPGDIRNINGTVRVMACHESEVGEESPCIGWVYNQLGTGNNIALRMLALDGRFNDIKVVGKQHETFEATLSNNCDL